MANPRKPDNVHKLRGTYDASRHGNPDSKPDWSTEEPDAPDYLDAVAAAEWSRVIGIVPSGVLTKTDTAILAQYCEMYSRFARFCMGEIEHFTAADHTQLRLIQQELGFTPISRGKIGGAPKKQDDSGPQSIPR